MAGLAIIFVLMIPGVAIYSVAVWIWLSSNASVETPFPLWFLVVFWGAPFMAVVGGAVVGLVLGIRDRGRARGGGVMAKAWEELTQ